MSEFPIGTRVRRTTPIASTVDDTLYEGEVIGRTSSHYVILSDRPIAVPNGQTWRFSGRLDSESEGKRDRLFLALPEQLEVISDQTRYFKLAADTNDWSSQDYPFLMYARPYELKPKQFILWRAPGFEDDEAEPFYVKKVELIDANTAKVQLIHPQTYEEFTAELFEDVAVLNGRLWPKPRKPRESKVSLTERLKTQPGIVHLYQPKEVAIGDEVYIYFAYGAGLGKVIAKASNSYGIFLLLYHSGNDRPAIRYDLELAKLFPDYQIQSDRHYIVYPQRRPLQGDIYRVAVPQPGYELEETVVKNLKPDDECIFFRPANMVPNMSEDGSAIRYRCLGPFNIHSLVVLQQLDGEYTAHADSVNLIARTFPELKDTPNLLLVRDLRECSIVRPKTTKTASSKTYFHGTNTHALPDVLKYGLVRGPGMQGVSLTHSFDFAAFFADLSHTEREFYAKAHNRLPVILEIDVPQDKLKYYTNFNSPYGSVDEYLWTLARPLPASYITRACIFKDNSWYQFDAADLRKSNPEEYDKLSGTVITPKSDTDPLSFYKKTSYADYIETNRFLANEFGDTYRSNSVVYEIPGVQTRVKQGYVILDADLDPEQKAYELVRVYPSLHFQFDDSLAKKFSESPDLIRKYASDRQTRAFADKSIEEWNSLDICNVCNGTGWDNEPYGTLCTRCGGYRRVQHKKNYFKQSIITGQDIEEFWAKHHFSDVKSCTNLDDLEVGDGLGHDRIVSNRLDRIIPNWVVKSIQPLDSQRVEVELYNPYQPSFTTVFLKESRNWICKSKNDADLYFKISSENGETVKLSELKPGDHWMHPLGSECVVVRNETDIRPSPVELIAITYYGLSDSSRIHWIYNGQPDHLVTKFLTPQESYFKISSDEYTTYNATARELKVGDYFSWPKPYTSGSIYQIGAIEDHDSGRYLEYGYYDDSNNSQFGRNVKNDDPVVIVQQITDQARYFKISSSERWDDVTIGDLQVGDIFTTRMSRNSKVTYRIDSIAESEFEGYRRIKYSDTLEAYTQDLRTDMSIKRLLQLSDEDRYFKISSNIETVTTDKLKVGDIVSLTEDDPDQKILAIDGFSYGRYLTLQLLDERKYHPEETLFFTDYMTVKRLSQTEESKYFKYSLIDQL